ncbi:Retrovirus-related Pol polyprotein type-1 like protein [Argiope bruennichi]|uniref:Retrovirus-related Pol polyprotein type-1 like protein n=1 Tax=Argiope bruennichi TaxID=94029 RepID=A0A8T0EZ49_ARGBR|nr:Retrovirus-related Pol polyprotein type-1 like protein [Argiope bruennichi]
MHLSVRSENAMRRGERTEEARASFERLKKVVTVSRTDSLSLLTALASLKRKTWILKQLIDKIKIVNTNHRPSFFWVKAHIGVTGNEEVDKQAKLATRKNTVDSPVPRSHNTLKADIHQNIIEEWQNEWASTTKGPQTHQYFPKVSTKIETFHPLIIQFLSGHGRFPSYFQKFGITDNPLCDCGDVGTPDHYIFECAYTQSLRQKLNYTPTKDLLIQDPKNLHVIQQITTWGNLGRSFKATKELPMLFPKITPDVYCVQEPYLHAGSTFFPTKWRTIFHPEGSVLISIRNPNIAVVTRHINKYFVCVDVSKGPDTFTIISYFPPSSNKNSLFQNLNELIDYIQPKQWFLVGDGNIQSELWGPDRDDSKRKRDIGAPMIDFIIHRNLLVWNDSNAVPTFQTNNGRSWIDVTLSTSSLYDRKEAWQLERRTLSYHSYILFSLAGQTHSPPAQSRISKRKLKRLAKTLEKHYNTHLETVKDLKTTGEVDNLSDETSTQTAIRVTNEQYKSPTSDPAFMRQEIRQVLHTLKPKTASGPDQLSLETVKILFKQNPGVIELLFNSCLSLGHFPTSWKAARLWQTIQNALRHKGKACILSVDVSGAFDNVWRESILHQLTLAGCSQNLFDLIKDYFSQRHGTIEMQGQTWSFQIERGVPQGSCSGPVFWNVIVDTALNLPISP